MPPARQFAEIAKKTAFYVIFTIVPTIFLNREKKFMLSTILLRVVFIMRLYGLAMSGFIFNHEQGLTLEQSTDVGVLKRELEKLERQLKELNIAHRTRYSPVQVRDHLKEVLEHKVGLRDELADELELMKSKRYKLKIAVEAAQAYLKIQPPHQTIGEAVVTAIIRANNLVTDKTGGEEGMVRGTPSMTFEDDDPTREKEAEIMLEYIEKFNELLEDGLVEEAAVHAANSPKGILRTPETLNRFKDMSFRTNEGRAPMLAFCDALMSTVPAYGIKPNEVMSLECVKCALEENRLDLLVHWMSQERLSLTEQIGKTIQVWCEVHPAASKCYRPLAQSVYKAIGAHVPAIMCMLQQGRLYQAVDYAQSRAHLELPDYMAVLLQCPSTSLVTALYPSPEKALVPLGVLLTTLLKTDAYQLGLDHVLKIHQNDNKKVLSDAVFGDDVTTQAEWRDVSMCLHEQGFPEVALHLLAVVTASFAVKDAFSVMRRIEEEQAAEERRKAAQAEAAREKLQQKKGKSRRSRHQAPPVETPSQEKGGETLQLTRKVKRVEICGTAKVQQPKVSTGFNEMKEFSISSIRLSPTLEEPLEAGSSSGMSLHGAAEVPGNSMVRPGMSRRGNMRRSPTVEFPEFSTLESSLVDDKSQPGLDYVASGGEMSKSSVTARKMYLPKPPPPRVTTAGSTVTEDEITNEGYEADVE